MGGTEAEQDPTCWEIDPHTEAKHGILRGYLEAWMPILANQTAKISPSSGPLRYIDGFAGPGEYTGGEPGSPLIAIDVAEHHAKRFPVPVKMMFIEQREDRYRHLRKLIEEAKERIASSPNLDAVSVRQNDCESLLGEILDYYEAHRRPLGPALVFLDQFGYSAVPMDLIGRIMKHPVCEVFSFLNWRDLNRFISDQTKWPGITRAFGGDEWREAVPLASAERAAKLHELYRTALRQRAGVEYFCSFSMHGKDDRLLYWLFFCSGNLRGLYEMKRAMWKVDDYGSFTFSDRHVGQTKLLSGFDQRWLAEALAKSLAGEELAVAEIEEYVLVETPCYLFAKALQRLHRANRISVRGIPDGEAVAFAKFKNNPGVRVQFKVQMN